MVVDLSAVSRGKLQDSGIAGFNSHAEIGTRRRRLNLFGGLAWEDGRRSRLRFEGMLSGGVVCFGRGGVVLYSIWWILFYGWMVLEIFVALVMRTRRGGGKVADRGTMLMLWIAIFGSITVATAMGEAHGARLPFGWARPEAVYWIRVAAVGFLMLGLVIRFSAIVALGKAFSANVAIRETQTVRTTGLYRWMRHPSYTGLFLCLFAVALHTRNWIAFLVALVLPTVALLYRIRVEEAALRTHFGQEYIEYSGKTKRLLPGIY